MTKLVPLSGPDISQREIDMINEVIATPYLSMGPMIQRFEEAMAAYMGCGHAVGVSSGTAGLHLAVIAGGVGEGDLVITTPFSFVASANCILGVPIGDTFVAIVRRALSRGQVLAGDRRHVYDLIRARGVGDTTTVLMMAGISAVAGATGLVVDGMDTLPAFVVFVAAFVAFCSMAIWLGAPKAA